MNLLSIVVYVSAFFGFFTASFFLITYLSHRRRLTDPKPKKIPFVSFIIPVFNEEKEIKETIESLLNINYPKNKYEVIIVDDGSTDNTYKVARKFESKNVKVFTKENGGCADALNFGIKKARGELIARFDADSVLDKDALMNIIGHFNDPKVMAVTSSLNVKNNKSFLEKIQWAEYLLGIFLRKIFDLNNSIHVIPGPLSVYRKVFFKKHGLFDKTNITEDIEIAMRIQSLGYKIKNSIKASVYTTTPKTFLQLLRQRIRWYTGFFHNLLNYVHLLNPTRKTNLSMFLLPSAVFSLIISFFSFGVLFYYSLSSLKKTITMWSVIKLDIGRWVDLLKLQPIKEIVINFLTNQYIFFLIVSIIIILLIFLLAKHHSNEKRNFSLTFFLFLFFYSFLYIIWWTAAIFYFVSGKKQFWGRRVYIRGKLKLN